MAPRLSSPMTWNAFFPISTPITVTVLFRFWDMVCSFALEPLARFVTGGAGARPDHPISGHPRDHVGCPLAAPRNYFFPGGVYKLAILEALSATALNSAPVQAL